jgi:hypothetical protein
LAPARAQGAAFLGPGLGRGANCRNTVLNGCSEIDSAMAAGKGAWLDTQRAQLLT